MGEPVIRSSKVARGRHRPVIVREHNRFWRLVPFSKTSTYPSKTASAMIPLTCPPPTSPSDSHSSTVIAIINDVGSHLPGHYSARTLRAGSTRPRGVVGIQLASPSTKSKTSEAPDTGGCGSDGATPRCW